MKFPMEMFRLAAIATALFAADSAFAQEPPAQRTLHFSANGNFGSNGEFLPGEVGFNLADVSDRQQLDQLPERVKGLVWVGLCNGADEKFVALAQSVIDDPKLYGFYLMDEPDPTGRWGTKCDGANLREESDWIHAKRADAVTYIALMNLGNWKSPNFGEAFAPKTSHIDLFGVSPYPCRVDWKECDLDMIDRFAKAASDAGVPRDRIVPIFQVFGGGSWRTDGGGAYRLPQPEEVRSMLAAWAELAPAPAFDCVYSWGVQRGDEALVSSTALQRIFALHNQGRAIQQNAQ